jgi:orotidine-5'-phosphate decarboxylase
MDRQALIKQIKLKKSCLCVGLDTDLTKIPKHLLEESDPIFAFNKAIIDATAEYAIAYKPNMAFYEAYGLDGWQSLKKTIDYLNKNYPDHFTIADAKRGDIGNTAARYAKAFFEELAFDSITVAPYMGSDSVKPFMDFEGKWTIVLGLTSNEGAQDFQFTQTGEQLLFEKVLEQVSTWGNPNNTMFVVGATKAAFMKKVRAVVPNHFLLVPGVGAQGGTVTDVMEHASIPNDVGLLINASRSVIYASSGIDFAEKAAESAEKLRMEISLFIQ